METLFFTIVFVFLGITAGYYFLFQKKRKKTLDDFRRKKIKASIPFKAGKSAQAENASGRRENQEPVFQIAPENKRRAYSENDPFIFEERAKEFQQETGLPDKSNDAQENDYYRTRPNLPKRHIEQQPYLENNYKEAKEDQESESF